MNILSENKIEKAFKKNANGKAFVAFLTAGDPTPDATVSFVLEMAKQGVDLVEIGIPFSDPTAEGSVIQEANLRSLSGGMTTDKAFEIVSKVRETEKDLALCFMTYANVIFHYGYERFFDRCAELGVDGVIVPDLPYEEQEEMRIPAEERGLRVISMVAPTSEDRVKQIAAASKGFLYVVSSMGVTGTRTSFSTGLDEIVKGIREVSDVPCAIGFGISNPEQAAKMAGISDGAIVGSAIVRIIEQYGAEAAPHIGEFVKDMARAVHNA